MQNIDCLCASDANLNNLNLTSLINQSRESIVNITIITENSKEQHCVYILRDKLDIYWYQMIGILHVNQALQSYGTRVNNTEARNWFGGRWC